MDIQKEIGELVGMDPVSATYDMDRKAIVSLMLEIVATADIIGHMIDGTTLYKMHLSPEAADTLAALFSDSDGEEEDDEREPENEV